MRFSRPSTLSPSLYRITDEFLVQVGVPNESRLRDDFWIELFIAFSSILDYTIHKSQGTGDGQ